MIIIGGIGFAKGDPVKLISVYDSDDRSCGRDANVTDFPFVYLVTPLPNYFDRSLCLKNCPTAKEKNASKLECSATKNITCYEHIFPGMEDISKINYNNRSIASLLEKTVFIYNCDEFFGRYCLVIYSYFII